MDSEQDTTSEDSISLSPYNLIDLVCVLHSCCMKRYMAYRPGQLARGKFKRRKGSIARELHAQELPDRFHKTWENLGVAT